ncbi:hypothetical protein ABEO66_27300 [Bacillus pacificus]|uniref:hypothetical protein n=1 Tax=Bacillus pacificus TaxID=2026187 RepID=UPI003D23D897
MCKAGFADEEFVSMPIKDITILSKAQTTVQINFVDGNCNIDTYDISQDSIIIFKSNSPPAFPGIAVAFIPNANTKNTEDLICFIKNCLLPHATTINTSASKIILTATK